MVEGSPVASLSGDVNVGERNMEPLAEEEKGVYEEDGTEELEPTMEGFVRELFKEL